MFRAIFISFVVSAGLTGCDSMQDISRDPRYQTLIGREVRTRVPMRLYDRNSPAMAMQTPCELTLTNWGDHWLVDQVPAGQAVRFDEARRYRNMHSADEYLRGEMVYKGRRYWIEHRVQVHEGTEVWLELFDRFDAERPPPKTY